VQETGDRCRENGQRRDHRNGRTGKKTVRPSVAPSHQPGLGRHQRQVCHCRCQEHLKERLDAPDVARLPHAQLHQSRDPMLRRLAKLSIGRKSGAPLERARLLQQGFLGVEADRAPLPRSRPDALGPQRTRRARRGVKAKPLQYLSDALPIREALQHHQRRAGLPGRAGTGLGATGSIAKSSLTKNGLFGRSGTFAISVRSASANAWRVAPSP